MKCPACGNTMQQTPVGGVTVDVCKGGCGGVWFDRFELQKVDEPTEASGEALLEVERSPSVTVDHEARRNCPKCSNVVMMQHFHSVKGQVVVDECPTCGGFFLDYGELARVRSSFGSEEERKKATDTYFGEVFGHQLATMRGESSEKRDKARSIARMFKFACPSYYLKGKQDWGAF
ncbi:MAG: hypothetical protein GF331_16025 [Chitinivibrionales bacterium]|nr:hypothetical protein [Chitinivibrionales bacterium]